MEPSVLRRKGCLPRVLNFREGELLLRGSRQQDFHRPESMPGPASPAADCEAAGMSLSESVRPPIGLFVHAAPETHSIKGQRLSDVAPSYRPAIVAAHEQRDGTVQRRG